MRYIAKRGVKMDFLRMLRAVAVVFSHRGAS